ncbi:F-box domain [Kluyveromyces marxianus]|uniref:F-box domain n=2 Tax=Kluyveromyces marxianus TaxID=4911 RepID=W0T2Y4_KLUMD|nr:F-box-like family protein [Kluyveromyces marxianus DMKU3-1042]QGN14059.1 F-box domain [Kluyveromyces marxianus]BAO37770.1 F-box domain [Kluyveromyces marxianus DMKU3-1042]
MATLKRTGDNDLILKKSKVSKVYLNSEFKKDFGWFLQTIPHEVLVTILNQISNKEKISLATTCKTVRHILMPYIFANVKCPWEQLLDEPNWPLDPSIQHLIESLRITTSCSKNEWTYPFQKLFSNSEINKLRNLRSLHINSSGSTSFFKYCDVAENLKELSVTTTKERSLFSLEHVRPFKNLEYLNVSNFQIDDFVEDGALCPKLESLRLNNCSWEYPFEIENFGRNKIRSLSLEYSNSFIISERFRDFLTHPGFTSLESLEITNTETNLKLTISLEIMKLIKNIPTLRVLKLKGNIYNETLNNFTKIDVENCMNYIALDNVKVFYCSFFSKG